MEETLNDKKILDKINEVLEDKNSILKISLDDNQNIRVKEIESNLVMENNSKDKNINEVKKEEVSKIKKITKSFFKVFEEFFDTIAKNFLKKKYKINNSVYNDGKKAFIAVKNRDSKTFLKKITDAILNLIKKIPTDKRKIIKNTKNVAIDEIYSWKE